MIRSQGILAAATLLGAVALWFLLPRARGRGRNAGILLGAVSLGLLGSQMPRLGNWAADSVLFTLSTVTVVAAAATVTLRNPIYCAIWFGLTLAGTAGLFLMQGAEFLSVATVIVYAGAILVTFLFLLMLADPQGRAYYDHTAWEAAVSAFTGAVIVGVLSITSVSVLRTPPPELSAASPSAAEREVGVLSEAHVQRLGQALFEQHLIAVEVAGVLLLTALVGAAAIVAQGREKPPQLVPGPTDRVAAQTTRQASPDGTQDASQRISTKSEKHG